MIQVIKNRVLCFLIISVAFIQTKCKNNEFNNSESKTIEQQSIEEEKLDVKATKAETYYFNKVFKKQIFPINYDIATVKKEFYNSKFSLYENELMYSDCATEIRIKKDKTKNYLNGTDGVQLYNDILSEADFKLTDEVKYIITLYPDNKCNLPSDSFILLDENNILFVYKGYLILYSKSINQEAKEDIVPKLICEDEKGSMEEGFSTTCFVNENLEKAYEIFIKESQINEIEFLQKKFPLSNVNYTKKGVEILYKKSKNNLNIELLFPGGETFITFTYQNNKTEIKINNFPQ